MPIYKKINDVMKRVTGVDKGSTNSHGRYKYAGHEAVTEALRGHYAEVGIVRTAHMESMEVLEGATVCAKVVVTFTDIEDNSQVVIPMFTVQPSQTSNKTLTAQQVGQALSYAVKNAEFKAFSLKGDTEPDSDATPPRFHHDGPEMAHTGEAQRAEELLKMFDKATSADEVEKVTKDLKAEWKDLKAVPGLADEVVKRKGAALNRLKVA